MISKAGLLYFLCISFLCLQLMASSNKSGEPFLADSLKVLLQENNKADTNRFNALDVVINNFYKQRLYNEAKPYVNEMTQLANKLNDNYAKALSNYYSSSIFLSEDRYEEALEVLLNASNLASILISSKKNIRLRILIYNSLSVCYFKKQKFEEFYANIQNGLDLNKELKDISLEFELKSKLAITYRYLGRDSLAIAINKELISNSRFKGQNMYYPLFHLGAFNMDLHNYDSALIYFTKADLYAALPVDKAWIYLNKGIIYNIQGAYKKAIKILLTCLDTVSLTSSIEIEANACIELGKSYHKLFKHDTAVNFINKGIELAHTNQYLNLEVKGLEEKMALLHDQGNFEEFATYALKFIACNDSLNTINNINKLSELVFQQKVKDEKEQVKYKQYMVEAKHRQQLFILYFILLFLVSTIIVILLLLNRKNINIKNKIIKQDLLSKELDLRNREMTAKVLSQVQKKQMLSDIIEKLTNIELNKQPVKNIHNIVNELKESLSDDTSADFDYYFVQTHPEFYDSLRADFPNLTPHELRLCAFLKLNLNTKDIATINNISIDSAKVARSRLRKKLQLKNPDENLVNFLSKY